jgi:hypothetical protein
VIDADHSFRILLNNQRVLIAELPPSPAWSDERADLRE